MIAETTAFAALLLHGSSFQELYAVTVPGSASTGTTSPATSERAAKVVSWDIRGVTVGSPYSAASCWRSTSRSDRVLPGATGSPEAFRVCCPSPLVGQEVLTGVSSTTRSR